jgi:dolichol-phosphate mannosyltransferase
MPLDELTTSELFRRLPADGATSAAAVTGVSVVIPMFNEEACCAELVRSLDALRDLLGGRYAFEFLLIDDGSVDATVTTLEELTAGREPFRILRHSTNQGIAASIQTGLRAARHEVVASIDSDGSYDPALLAEMLPLLADGVDLVTASPYHIDGRVVDVPAWRLAISRLASRLYRVAIGNNLSCYTSCFRVYRRDAALAAAPTCGGFVGIAEQLWRMHRRGSAIVECPAVLRSRVAGVSKMRVLKAARGHLKLIGTAACDRMVRPK